MSEDYDNPMLREAEEEVARQGNRQSGEDVARSVRNSSAMQTIKYVYQDLKNAIKENSRELVLAGICAATLAGLFYAADQCKEIRWNASCKERNGEELSLLEKIVPR